MTSQEYIAELEDTINMQNVDIELLLDYITHLELKYLGKIVNGRLPLFDDDDR